MPRNPAFPIETDNLKRWQPLSLDELVDLQLKIMSKLDKIDSAQAATLGYEYADLLEQLDAMIVHKQTQQDADAQAKDHNQRRD